MTREQIEQAVDKFIAKNPQQANNRENLIQTLLAMNLPKGSRLVVRAPDAA